MTHYLKRLVDYHTEQIGERPKVILLDSDAYRMLEQDLEMPWSIGSSTKEFEGIPIFKMSEAIIR